MAAIMSTILNGKRIFPFTGINRLIRSTSATIMPVEAKNDIKKTICDLSGSKKYAHGRLKQPANKAALTPMEPYSNKEANVISAPKIASTPHGIRAAMIPNTERIIKRMNFSPIIWLLDTGMVITFLLHFEFASLVILIKTAVVAHGGAKTKARWLPAKPKGQTPKRLNSRLLQGYCFWQYTNLSIKVLSSSFPLYIEKHNFVNRCRNHHCFRIFFLHFLPV